MKKKFNFFYFIQNMTLLILFVSLSGCSSPPYQVKDPITNFSCNAEITLQDNKISCDFSRSPEGISEMTIQSPEDIKGLQFKWLGNGYSISYNSLSCETPSPFLPTNSFVMSIINALNEVAKPDTLTLISSQKNSRIFSGNSDSGKFQITVDNQTGFITDISFEEDTKLKIHFNHEL